MCEDLGMSLMNSSWCMALPIFEVLWYDFRHPYLMEDQLGSSLSLKNWSKGGKAAGRRRLSRVVRLCDSVSE